MKALRPTLFLLILAILGGVYIYFNERGAPVSQGTVVLLRAPREGVKSIKLSPANLELQRKNGSWRVQNASFSVPADPEAVKNLLDALQLVQSDAPIENATDLRQYGLEKPAARLDVDGQILEFGISPSFDTSRVYARSGERIALISAILSEEAKKTLAEWRDRAVLRFDAEKIADFSLQTPHGSLQLEKAGELWNLKKPVAGRADPEGVNAFLSALEAAQVSSWLDESGENAKKWGLEKPIATLSIGQARLEVGARQKGGYTARNSASKAVFLLPDATFALLGRPLRDWRDKTVARFDINRASRVEVSAGEQRKVLLRRDDAWQNENGESNQQTRAAALELLAFAAEMRARDFIEVAPNPAKYGLDKPFLTLQIEADTPIQLRFGRVGQQIYAQKSGSQDADTIFVLSSNALRASQEALAQLRPKPGK